MAGTRRERTSVMDTDDVLGHARGDLTMPGRSLLRRVVSTDDQSLFGITRIALGLLMVAHGTPPAILLALLLFTGTLVRAAALATIALLYIGGPNSLLDIVAVPIAVVSIIAGAGRFSVDHLLMRRRAMPGGSVDDRFVNP